MDLKQLDYATYDVMVKMMAMATWCFVDGRCGETTLLAGQWIVHEWRRFEVTNIQPDRRWLEWCLSSTCDYFIVVEGMPTDFGQDELSTNFRKHICECSVKYEILVAIISEVLDRTSTMHD